MSYTNRNCRLAAGMIEEALASHPSVAECAVIAVPDEIKGEVPVGFIVLKAGTTKRPADVAKECVEVADLTKYQPEKRFVTV
jgi:propionyl-CoA synthetase